MTTTTNKINGRVDGNIETFFDSQGIFSNSLITQKDILLFDNLKLKHYNLIFNQVVTLDSYYKTSVIDATLNFNSKSLMSFKHFFNSS